MALEQMRKAALEVMKQAGARAADTQRYEAEFTRAATSGDPPPCPTCFMRGEINRLNLPTPGSAGIARCKVCRELIELEDIGKPRLNVQLAFISAVTIIALWAIVGWVLPGYVVDAGSEGAFGDRFGSVNALFSGMAFAGIIVTIWTQSSELALQRHQLALQRIELELTREELRGQKEQLAAQNQTMQKQVFETTFFALVRRFREIADEMADTKDQLRTAGFAQAAAPPHSLRVPLHYSSPSGGVPRYG